MRTRDFGNHILAAVLLTLAAGCAGTRPDSLETLDGGRVSIKQSGGMLGETVRRVGEESGGGLVLMRGVEDRPVGEISLSNASFRELAGELARQTGLTVEETPHFYFLYPQGYENLTQITVADQLDPTMAALRTGVSFGGQTRLFNAFGVMSHNLGKTILADNIVADSECGELFITDAPLGAVLEAVLKSARVYPEAIVVESTPEYVFIRSVQNPAPQNTRIATGDATPAMEEALAKQVTVYLPERPAANAGLTIYRAPVSLKTVLAPLSEQTGLPMHAAGPLHDLPVNFAVFHGLSVSKTLDLLIRQWPLDVFGYEVRADGVHIVRR